MHLRQAVRTVVSVITVQTVLMAAQQGAVQPGVVASAVTDRPVTTGNKAAVTKTRLTGSKMPMPLVAPLFVQDETTDSEITIVSNFSKSLGVDVVLSGHSGEQLAKEKVQMEPYSQKKLKISDLLARGQSDTNARYGSVLLMADRPASLAAQLSIVDNSRPSPADVEEEFVMLMDSKPADYRAVTSGLSTMPILAIRSLSAAEQKVSVRCLMQHGGDRSTNIAIAPNQTVLVQVCNAREAKQINRLQDALEGTSHFTNVVGVAVSSSASSEELAVFGVGLHGKAWSSALSAIPFWDVNTLRSSSAVYPGVAPASGGVLGSGSFNFRVALANFSNLPKTATVLTTSGSGRDSTEKTVATLKLAANSVSTTDLTDVSQDALATKSVVVQADGSPGEVLSDLQAVTDSDTALPPTTLPWKDQGQVDNGGEHPWTVGRSTSSAVLLFNPDPAVTNSHVHLTIHAGSSTWTKQLSLAPLSTISISLNDIIQKQQPDDNGTKLPAGASQGIVTWSALDQPRIFGKLIQFDGATRIARNYACGSITSICNVILNAPEPSSVLIGQQAFVTINSNQACTGDSACSCNDTCGSASASGGSATWFSSDAGCANAVNSSSLWAYYQGYSAGQVWADAQVVDNNGCSASGNTLLTVQDITSAIQQNNISDIIQSAVSNGDGSYTLTMNLGDYYDFFADAQSGAPTSICPCDITVQVLRLATLATAAQFVINDIRVLQQLGIIKATRTPIKDQPPNSDQTYPSPNGANKGKTTRVFGSDGRATHDIDYGDQSHSQWNPEVHDWDWSSGSPVRQPPRQPQPSDFPPGVPTTWP